MAIGKYYITRPWSQIGVDTRAGTFAHNAAPSDLRATTAWALEQLGVSYIDIAVLNREDPGTPIEVGIDTSYNPNFVNEGLKHG